MKRKREEGDDQVAEVEDGSPPSLLLSMPDLVHYELTAYLAFLLPVFLPPPPDQLPSVYK
jgi:hypothetical protein